MSSSRVLRSARTVQETTVPGSKRKRTQSQPSAPTKRGKSQDTAASSNAVSKKRTAAKKAAGPASSSRASRSSLTSKASRPGKGPVVRRVAAKEDEEDAEDNDDEDVGSQVDEDEDGMPEERLGEDERDYDDDVDILNQGELAQWGRGPLPPNRGISQGSGEGRTDAVEISSSDEESPDPEANAEDRRKQKSRSKLNERVKQRQIREQPDWDGAPRTHSQRKTDDGQSESEDSDSASAPADSDPDPESLDIRISKGRRYPILSVQSTRLKTAIRKAFSVSEYKLAFVTAYPPADNVDRFHRDTLRDAAREVDDRELANEFKVNAPYGNSLAHLVKGRFSKYRLALRNHAGSEAKSAYQLKPGCGSAVQALLLDDTFVFNVDAQGRVINNQPYRHPALVAMIHFFFKDHRSVGQVWSGKFESSILPEQDENASAEKEVPIPMVAFSTAMLRAELSLWKFDRRETGKFDADQHYTVYEHHVEALTSLKRRWPMRFHQLMAFLYTQASTSTSSLAPKGCEGAGILGILGWGEDEPSASTGAA
ncbi:hypothetical protein NMY22_g3800 [Coprinellus aureogranulatus]|nr:hypothetical protein NMY22_g3800 [Coprinellus aureogranulatus]